MISQTEADALRAEVAELRTATSRMLALLAAVLPASSNSGQALHGLAANVGALLKVHSTPTLDEMASAVLLAASSTALKQFPQDPAIQATYQGLRSGGRH